MNEQIYKIAFNKVFQSWCRKYEETKVNFYDGLLSYVESIVYNSRKLEESNSKWSGIVDEAVALSFVLNEEKLLKEAYKYLKSNQFKLQEASAFLNLTIEDLNYNKWEYIKLFIQYLNNNRDNKNGYDVICSSKPKFSNETKNGTAVTTVNIPPDVIGDLLENVDVNNDENNDFKSFTEKFIKTIQELNKEQNKEENPLVSIQKLKTIRKDGKVKLILETDMQEAIQGFIMEKFWNNNEKLDSKKLLEKLQENAQEKYGFKNRIIWDTLSYEDFFETAYAELAGTKNGEGGNSDSWISYFVTLANQAGTAIRNLYDINTPRGTPIAIARGLNNTIVTNNSVNSFFSEKLFNQQKDTVNKADILLYFPNNKISEQQSAQKYIDNCLSISRSFENGDKYEAINEYCSICDEALSAGRVLGLSLKKGTKELHIELLSTKETVDPTTTSTDEKVFGRNAMKSIKYYGENNDDNTFRHFDLESFSDKAVNNSKDVRHLIYNDGKLSAEPNISTCTLKLMLNDNSDMKDSFGNYVEVAVKTNGGQKDGKTAVNATIEAKSNRPGSKAQMGKLVDSLKSLIGADIAEQNVYANPNITNPITRKLNSLLGYFNALEKDENKDYKIAATIASTGYPLVKVNDDGEFTRTDIIMAPIIKLS